MKLKMHKLIKQNLKKMNYDLRASGLYWKTSVSNMVLIKEFRKLFQKYAMGKVLDAGAGHLLYRDLLSKYSESYESLDFEKTHPELTYVADIQNMKNINSDSYDFIFCRNVLEHVPEPEKGFSEIGRILKKNKYALITVPHLGYLHNEPHDYWRFTKYSLKNLAKKNNLEIIKLEEMGGLVAFNAYIFQTIFMGLTYGIPIVGKICLFLNLLIQKILLYLDKIIGMKRLFPLDYLIL